MRKLRAIPGVGPVTAPAIVAWVADPRRFRSQSGLSSYAGLGLKQDVSNWKPTKHAHASKRGNRELKRALFLSARGALNGTSALRQRYDARIAAGWEDRKAIRDIARTILFIACGIWKRGTEYDDAKVGSVVAFTLHRWTLVFRFVVEPTSNLLLRCGLVLGSSHHEHESAFSDAVQSNLVECKLRAADHFQPHGIPRRTS